MPIIEVKYAAAQGRRVARSDIAKAASALAADVLGKSPAVTAVVVEEVAAQNWFCGGRALAESGLASFWLSIRITEGTNTRAEMGDFVAATFSAMGSLLGPVHEDVAAWPGSIHRISRRASDFGRRGHGTTQRSCPVPSPR